MKQIEYTDLQQAIINVISRLGRYLRLPIAWDEIESIKKDYDIKDKYLTLKEYILNRNGAYHTFHFELDGKEITIKNINEMLCLEYYLLYPLTEKYYVVKDERKDNEGNCENYHCDHYLTLEEKED